MFNTERIMSILVVLILALPMVACGVEDETTGPTADSLISALTGGSEAEAAEVNDDETDSEDADASDESATGGSSLPVSEHLVTDEAHLALFAGSVFRLESGLIKLGFPVGLTCMQQTGEEIDLAANEGCHLNALIERTYEIAEAFEKVIAKHEELQTALAECGVQSNAVQVAYAECEPCQGSRPRRGQRTRSPRPPAPKPAVQQVIHRVIVECGSCNSAAPSEIVFRIDGELDINIDVDVDVENLSKAVLEIIEERRIIVDERRGGGGGNNHCTDEYAPVCVWTGTEFIQFSNSCYARLAGWQSFSLGTCEGRPTPRPTDKVGDPTATTGPGSTPTPVGTDVPKPTAVVIDDPCWAFPSLCSASIEIDEDDICLGDSISGRLKAKNITWAAAHYNGSWHVKVNSPSRAVNYDKPFSSIPTTAGAGKVQWKVKYAPDGSEQTIEADYTVDECGTNPPDPVDEVEFGPAEPIEDYRNIDFGDCTMWYFVQIAAKDGGEDVTLFFLIPPGRNLEGEKDGHTFLGTAWKAWDGTRDEMIAAFWEMEDDVPSRVIPIWVGDPGSKPSDFKLPGNQGGYELTAEDMPCGSGGSCPEVEWPQVEFNSPGTRGFQNNGSKLTVLQLWQAWDDGIIAVSVVLEDRAAISAPKPQQGTGWNPDGGTIECLRQRADEMDEEHEERDRPDNPDDPFEFYRIWLSTDPAPAGWLTVADEGTDDWPEGWSITRAPR